MTLPRLVRRSEHGSGMLWEDTKKLAKNGKSIYRIALPEGVNIEEFARTHKPRTEVPDGCDLGYREIFETEERNGNRVSVAKIAYILAER